MNAFVKDRGVQDASYRRATTRIALTMLVMLTLFYGLNWTADLLCDVMLLHADAVSEAVAREMFDSAAYLLSFMLPVLFLRMMTPVSERTTMPTSPKLPRRLWLLLPAGLAIIYVCAITNSVFLGWIGLSPSNSGFQWTEGMAAHEAILFYLASVLVPAFCEEFLFRGAVLAALLPYSKTTAVLGSAFLFGLMHQNAGQLFYTIAAGVVLALLVLNSGSIWVAVLLHMFNNLFNVAQNVLRAQMGSRATLPICILELVVIGGGLAALVWLIVRGEWKTDALTVGAEQPSRPAKGFFTPPMIVYVALCVLHMIFMLILTKGLAL